MNALEEEPLLVVRLAMLIPKAAHAVKTETTAMHYLSNMKKEFERLLGPEEKKELETNEGFSMGWDNEEKTICHQSVNYLSLHTQLI